MVWERRERLAAEALGPAQQEVGQGREHAATGRPPLAAGQLATPHALALPLLPAQALAQQGAVSQAVGQVQAHGRPQELGGAWPVLGQVLGQVALGQGPAAGQGPPGQPAGVLGPLQGQGPQRQLQGALELRQLVRRQLESRQTHPLSAQHEQGKRGDGRDVRQQQLCLYSQLHAHLQVDAATPMIALAAAAAHLLPPQPPNTSQHAHCTLAGKAAGPRPYNHQR